LADPPGAYFPLHLPSPAARQISAYFDEETESQEDILNGQLVSRDNSFLIPPLLIVNIFLPVPPTTVGQPQTHQTATDIREDPLPKTVRAATSLDVNWHGIVSLIRPRWSLSSLRDFYTYPFEIYTNFILPSVILSSEEDSSMDAVYSCLIVGFFALSWLLLKLLERI
jgi:hypothetical protein